MKRFRKLSLVLAMSLVLTQMPLTGTALTWAEPAEKSVSEEAAMETVSAQEEAAQETVSGQKEEKAADEEAATGTVSGQDEEAASGNSVSRDTVEAETEEAAAGEDANMVNATTWEQVQEAFNNHKNVTLSADITSGGTYLLVSDNTTVTLDLNGHTINRNLINYMGTEGPAIMISGGKLTLEDNSPNKSGSITGGYAQSGGGVDVFNGGTFTMQGGNISGNKAVDGGGVYVWENSTFTMTDGKIENNTAYEKNGSYTPAREHGNGGGVWQKTPHLR